MNEEIKDDEMLKEGRIRVIVSSDGSTTQEIARKSPITNKLEWMAISRR